MAPRGVTVVSAFHTVSAAALSDPRSRLDEDVLIAGDDRKSKDDVADLVRRIPGLRPVDCGELEMARIIEQLTPLLISVNKRHKIKHSGVKLTGLDRHHRVIVLLSGGTGGAKLARGMLDLLGPDQLAVIANTGDDIAAFGLHVSPDPDLVTYWLAGVIDEERGFGIAGEIVQHVRPAREAGRRRTGSGSATGPRDLPAADRAPARGRAPDRDRAGDRGGVRSRRRPSCRCATSRCRPTCAPRASGGTFRST